MVNVLPKRSQDAAWSEMRARFILAISSALLALALFAAVALVPSYLALDLAVPGDLAKADAAGPRADIQGIGRASALINAALPLVSATTSPSQAIADALSDKPRGISISRITYSGGGSIGQITLNGTASRRDLNDFRSALQKDSRFVAVDVPVGSLVAESGSFSITLTGSF